MSLAETGGLDTGAARGGGCGLKEAGEAGEAAADGRLKSEGAYLSSFRRLLKGAVREDNLELAGPQSETGERGLLGPCPDLTWSERPGLVGGAL